MGTRADFYVGRTRAAEWLGSIAWDGYPDGIPAEIKGAKGEADFRAAVTAFLCERKDRTLPADGWPWPWDDSRTTDYAYAHDAEQTWASCFGTSWFRADQSEPEEEDSGDGGLPDFPDMKERRNVVLSGPRSGLIVLTSSGPE